MNKNKIFFTPEETVRHLHNLKAVIESEPCIANDDDTPGNKSTTCNWGLCTESRKVYDQESDSLFEKRFAPKYHLQCPMDKQKANPKEAHQVEASGCFYRCRIFKDGVRSRDKLLPLVELSIQRYQELSKQDK